MAKMKKTELDRALEEGGIPSESAEAKKENVASYKMVGESRVPVSKAHGKVWQSRRDQALSKRRQRELDTAWDEALDYYRNDQIADRQSSGGKEPRNRSVAKRMNNQFSEIENLVFANTNAIVPMLYAKNPRVEITLTNPVPSDAERSFATMVERLVNTLAAKKTAPGVNLKPKARKGVVNCTLTNTSWLEVGYTFKDTVSQQGLEELYDLAKQLETASKDDIEEIEGSLMAIEQQNAIVTPPGPWVKYRSGRQVLFDPGAEEYDGADGSWMMVCDFLPTAFIKATYGKENDKGEYAMIYAPTHVLRIGGDADSGLEDEVNSFSLLEDDGTYAKYGYANEEAFEAAQRTKVWWVWDKTTRRLLLFNDKDWTWPIWVWDDPYHLDKFFPLYKLEFHTDPEEAESKGEVTYYLDQQDAINEINDEERRARNWVRKRILYNIDSGIRGVDVDRFLKGDDDTAIGVSLGEDGKFENAVYSVPPPSVRYRELFDKTGKYQVIDRISSANEIVRGGQFKTNTTNQAIEQYNSVAGTRLDEKIDAIEDWIGDTLWGVAQLCLQYMTQEEVAKLVGAQSAQTWRNLQPDEIASTLSVRVAGGSTTKPTSQMKKNEAIQVGQVLGQFASVAPAAVVVALKLFQNAFDEVVIKEEDWTFIMQSVQQAMQRGASTGGGKADNGTAGTSDPLAQIEQLVNSLPPQAKEALGKALARGVPVRDALARIVQMTQGAQQGNENATSKTVQ